MTTSFLFGDFVLDTSRYNLRRGECEISLQPKVFDAILYLVENRDRVVRREELLDALWRGERVNDTAVRWVISRARKVLGQDPDSDYPIETVHGRGYRFTAEVHLGRQHAPASPAAPSLPPSVTARASREPFVGRQDVMDRLVAALHDARAASGRLVLLTGEAGIGKTRCLDEFALVARGLDIGAWTGRCLEGGWGAAFWPWLQVLRDALAEGSLSPTLAAEGQTLLEELIPHADADQRERIAASSAVAARFWLLEKLSRFLVRSAERTSRVVLLEDVHWADEASLDLLSFLGAELSSAKLLVVAAARDGEQPQSEAWTKALARLRPSERIALPSLNASDVATYVSAVVGVHLADEIQSAVYAKCGGNPLFLQETVRLLAQLGASRGFDALSPDDVTVPGVARDVLRARLTGLTAETCQVLEAACVIRQEFDMPMLQVALGVDAQELLRRLDDAVRGRLIEPRRRAGTFGFVHDTIREALYRELSAVWRTELHGRIAAALEKRPRGDFSVDELAYHAYRALPRSEPGRVEKYAVAAAQLAMGGFSYEEAARFYEWALEAERLREDRDPRRRCELLLDYARAVRLSGRVRDSDETVARAIHLAREHRFADLLSDAVRVLRPRVRAALVPDPVALQALEDATVMASEDDRSLRTRVLAQLACIPPYSLSMEKSRDISGRAVALARAGGDEADLVEALHSRLHALSGPDTIDELLDVADEMCRLGPYVTSNLRGEAEVARYYALVHKGDMAAAEQALEDLGHLGRSLRRAESLWNHERARATLALHAGRFDEAQAMFQELFARGHRMRLPYVNFFFMTYALVLAYERTGFALLQDASDWRRHLDWAASLPSYSAHEIRFIYEMGRIDDARRLFDAMTRRGFENITRELGFLNALAQLSLVAVALGERPAAESLYSLLRPYPNHNTPTNFGHYQGSVSFSLGLLAGLLGRTRDASAHLEDALAMNARLGCVPQTARTQLALANLLAESDAPGARARATELIGQATATATRLQMAPLLSQIERCRAEQPPSVRLPGRIAR
jgi:DNA-binding winged helix-turn-helix (wHTH) protein/tetratricopeptide (TPR) repeat protein